MQFELTDEIINQIIFSMEDQGGRYMFDSETGTITALNGEEKTNTQRYYSLPVWDSVSGFKIMERFVSALHNPSVREKLRAALFAGKGVFRAFKDVLKEYPEIENRWFLFKQRALKREITAWYNVLRDSWGLEKIGEEPEETDELVCADFNFRLYKEAADAPYIAEAQRSLEKEIQTVYKGELAQAFSRLYACTYAPRLLDVCTLVVRTNEDEFVGYISAQPFPEGALKTVLITSFYVFPVWRGMGVGKSLFMRCMETLKSKKIKRVLVPSVHIPIFFEQVMLRSGFQRFPAVFFADMDTEQ